MRRSWQCRVYQVNAFTRHHSAGNPAGVVLDADGLSDAQMRRLANTLPAPDTAFVFRPTAADHDVLVRFLNPRHETAFIGHATIAAQYVLAKVTGRSQGRVRQQTAAGLVDVELLQVDGDCRVAMTQAAPALGTCLAMADSNELLRALGLSETRLRADLPLQLAGQKASRLLIAVDSAAVLDTLKPDFGRLKRLSPAVGADGYFVFALQHGESSVVTHARLFCPVLGIPEDPVSGNTHAMLAVYLARHGVLELQAGAGRFRGHQGAWMGRPGIVEVEVAGEDHTCTAVRIMGDATIVAQDLTTIE